MVSAISGKMRHLLSYDLMKLYKSVYIKRTKNTFCNKDAAQNSYTFELNTVVRSEVRPTVHVFPELQQYSQYDLVFHDYW